MVLICEKNPWRKYVPAAETFPQISVDDKESRADDF